MNFGVAWSWFDVLAGTREVFVGSERERAGHAKHVARAMTASAGAGLRARRRGSLRRWLARQRRRPRQRPRQRRHPRQRPMISSPSGRA
jgi:hypothetical protein